MKPLCLILLILFAALVARAEKPNIVIFLSDDHTWRDSSLYGSTEIETPNMERVARNGMTFDRAFVNSPACAPARAALLTGLYPANNGAEPNHARPNADIKKLPACLQELGYEVVSFGKVGHYAQTPEYGFDLARHYGYHEDVAVPNAVEWLENRDSDQPLCLFVGTNWPHVPWPQDGSEFPADDLEVPPNHADTPLSRDWRSRYLAAVRIMDDELGMVYAAAREKFGDDFLFLHTSDHGAQWPFAKWNLYEDGVRTPFVAAWPGKIEPDVRTDAMVSWIDILPTLVEAAGGSPPADIDGRSVIPVLRGERDAHRELIFTTHSGDGNNNVFPIRSVRTADGWKYIRNLRPDFLFTSHATTHAGDSGYWTSWMRAAVTDPHARERVLAYQQRPPGELYNLNEDPWELDNLIDEAAHADRLASLSRQLDQWMDGTNDSQQVFGEPRKIAAPEKPNIITVLVDDMGYSDLSCFGGDAVETQHLDRLASEGLRFTQFYVNSPICSPSRVALTTGQYPQRWRITSFLNNRQSNEERGMAQWLDPDAPVLARQLQRVGYATGHFGKWHMGGQRDVANAPAIQEYGFDRSLTNFEGMGAKLLPLTLTPDSEEPGRIWQGAERLGGPFAWMQRSEITGGFVRAAIDFIDEAAALDRPFFVNVWPDDPHSPFFPPLDRWGDDNRSRYHGVIDAMDEQLAPLFDRIRNDETLRENTLIVVCSDNGHEPGAGRSDPLRGAKTWLYDGGIRSPLIVWGPGLLADGSANTVNDESVFSAIDINRSLYTLADATLPDGHTLDGEDLLPVLLGESRESREAPIFFRRPPDRPGEGGEDNPDLAVRDGKWKFLVNYDGSQSQLYNVATDPAESENLAEAFPDVARLLEAKVLAWNGTMPQDAGNPEFDTASPLPADRFVNPIGEGADPWIIRDPNADRYLWCFSEGNRGIAIHTSESLTSLGEKHVVWRAPDDGPTSRQVWAPELHWLDDRWHIYFAPSDGQNRNHRTYVLRSKTPDPLGEYELHGPLATGGGEDGRSPNLWAIDMTPLEHQGKLYALWSGWDEPDSDRQFLYIAPMKSPVELAGPRVLLCANDEHPWEFTEDEGEGRGLHEAPQVLRRSGRTFVTYSTGASWLPTYKLGLLELAGDDPLDPASWEKFPEPVFQSTPSTYGVGHSCFVPSPDGSEWWHVFHVKQSRQPGWERSIHVQPMSFDPGGRPDFGEPVAAGIPLPRPSGATTRAIDLPFTTSLESAAPPEGWDYYGHHQFIDFQQGGLHLGVRPQDPVNDFRSGEKLVLDAAVPPDFTAAVTIDFRGEEESRDAGLLFRATAPALGYDAQRGYFAGVIPSTDLVVLGRTDGTTWSELSRARTGIDPSLPQRLEVTCRGHEIIIQHNGKTVLRHSDQTFPRGSVGLRVVDTHAIFSDFTLTHPPR